MTFNPADVPEPPELAAQAAAIAAQREHQAQKCADCGEPRSAHGWKASDGPGTDRCRFVEATPVDSQMDICTCGHTRGGHHRLCNGRAGKFWCHCRQFALLRREAKK